MQMFEDIVNFFHRILEKECFYTDKVEKLTSCQKMTSRQNFSVSKLLAPAFKDINPSFTKRPFGTHTFLEQDRSPNCIENVHVLFKFSSSL